MKIIRTVPHEKYDCDKVAEIFSPSFCTRAKWTEENNYIPHGDEEAFVLADDAEVEIGWRVRGGELVPPSVEILADLKVDRRAEFAAIRYDEEVGGITYNGVRMHTDRESQSKYTAAIVALTATQQYPPVWKGIDGWLAISSAEDLMGLATAVNAHVAALYVKEAALDAQVEAAETVEAVKGITW
jgi:hypothetical protein